MISILSGTAAGIGAQTSDVTPVSLSDRFSGALARSYVSAGSERDAILHASSDPAVAADPQKLYELQLQQEAYTKKIAISSALVSHFTKGVETLLKS